MFYNPLFLKIIKKRDGLVNFENWHVNIGKGDVPVTSHCSLLFPWCFQNLGYGKSIEEKHLYSKCLEICVAVYCILDEPIFII
jgi:hypothetical protein